jgi:hypothetical protein
MAHPDPDQVIGRLAGARLGRMPAPAGELCPDSELLAAYVDGGLPDAEVARLEAHVAGCAACRRVLAALVPELAAGAAAEPVARGAVIVPFPQRRVVAWMAAAAGLLAAVTLWSVSRLGEPAGGTRMASVPAPADRGVAAAPAPPATAPEPGFGGGRPASSRDVAPDARPKVEATGRARESREALDRTAAGAERGDRAKASPSTSPAAEGKRLAEAAPQAFADEGVARMSAPPPPAAQTNTVVAGGGRARGPLAQQAVNIAQNVQNAAPAPPPSAPPPPPTPTAGAPAGAAPAAAAPAPAAPAAAAETAPVTTDTAMVGGVRSEEADGRTGALAAFSTAGAPALPSFAEPEGRLRWRIAGGTRLESSSDGGISWRERHRSRVRLRAGSAPTIDAAWAVGDRGVVLRFTVPGEWVTVTPPANVALVGVTATSAASARVTAADGRVFATTDGGQSWSAVGPEAPPR